MLGSYETEAILPPANCAPAPTGDIDPALTIGSPYAHWSCHHLISGNSLYWWNGGGEGSVHSSVVAPAPHGLSAACCLRMKAWATPKKNTSVPSAEISEPIEDT